MGYQKFKRPIDVRTKAAPDIKFDTMLSTGDVANVSLTATSSVAGATVSASQSVTASSSMVTATLTASGTATVNTLVASSSATINTLTVTSSAKANTFTATSAITAVTYKRTGITQSTAGSTALSARGILELGTSSTTAAANWILSVPAAGDEIEVAVKLNGSTFGVTVNASTATAVTFGAVAATTAQIRIALPGTLGNNFRAVALSTTQWLVTSHEGAVFSTDAA